MRQALAAIASWPAGRAAAGAVDRDGQRWAAGDGGRFAWASVTKTVTALAVLVACEEGTIALGDEVITGVSVRHLLAHAGGLGPDFPVRRLAAPGTRRVYSNAGFELLADHLAGRAAMTFRQYLGEAVLDPLGMTSTQLEGSAAAGLSGPLADLLAVAGELLRPTLVSPKTMAEASVVAFPGLDGVLPGFGMQRPCDWGLGFEIKDAKAPHWTGALNSPATFGHFGRSGSFVWVDPQAGLATAALADRDFGGWAAATWPTFSDGVLRAYRAGRQQVRSPG